MKRSDLAVFETIPYFTIAAVRQMAGDDLPGSERRARTRLWRWMQNGLVIQLKKGVYMTRRFYERHGAEPGFAAACSAILLPQSYLSLEYVLQRHALLTETTYPVTAVTLHNTRLIQNDLGVFSYRHVQPRLYYGFNPGDYHGLRYAEATPAKALFDYLYLRPLPRPLRTRQYALAEELRLNLERLDDSGRAEFAAHVRRAASPKMTTILDNLEHSIWQP